MNNGNITLVKRQHFLSQIQKATNHNTELLILKTTHYGRNIGFIFGKDLTSQTKFGHFLNPAATIDLMTTDIQSYSGSSHLQQATQSPPVCLLQASLDGNSTSVHS